MVEVKMPQVGQPVVLVSRSSQRAAMTSLVARLGRQVLVPSAFMVVKLAVVQLGAFILWLHRDAKAALTALKVGAGLYFAIVGWHLIFLARLLSR